MSYHKLKGAEAFVKKCITAILAIILTAGTVLPISFIAAPKSYAAATVSFESYVWHGTRLVKVTSDGALHNYKGTCGDAFHSAPGNGKATYTRVANTTSMARLAYYIEKHGLYKDATALDGNVVKGTVWNHAMQYARCKDKYGTSKSETPKKALAQMRSQANLSEKTTDRIVAAYEKAMKAVPVGGVPDSFELWALTPSSGQNPLLVWKYHPPGSGQVSKSDAEPTPRPAGYTFSGIVYNLYKADQATLVAQFVLDDNGNSQVIGGLDPGNYYILEANTNVFYKRDPNWIPVTVRENKHTVFYVSDWRQPYPATIVKKELNGNDIPRTDPKTGERISFKFHLVNTQNSSIAYDLTVYGNDTPSPQGTIEVLPGTYNVTEVSMPDKWIDKTGSGQITVPAGGAGRLEWTNEQPPYGELRIKKKATGSSASGKPLPLDGFTFRVEGELYNQGTLSKADVLQAAAPAVTLGDPSVYNDPTWTVDETDLAALNIAAENRETGTYDVKIKGKATRKNPVSAKTPAEIVATISPAPTEAGTGTISANTYVKNENKTYKAKNDVNYDYAFTDDAFDADKTAENITNLLSGTSFEEIDNSDFEKEITVKVKLESVEYDAESNKFNDKIKDKEDKSVVDGSNTVTYKDFTWAGAATIYKDVETGQNYSLLISNAIGEAYRDGHEKPGIDKGITKGKFTVTELPTDRQLEQYKIPEPQTQENTDDNPIFLFEEENKQYENKVRVRKTSPDGLVNGIAFKLSGTTLWGESLDRDGVTAAIADKDGNVTDGVIDFGTIPAGHYILEETGFDPEKYVNNHKMPGREYPAVEVDVPKVVATEENDGQIVADIEVEFDNLPITSLYIAKYDGDSYDFLEGAEFELHEDSEDGELAARFQIVKNDDETAGVNMIWSNGVIEGKMSKTIDPEDEEYESPDSTDVDPDALIEDDDSNGDDSASGDQGGDQPNDQGQDQGQESGGNTSSEVDPDTLKWAKITRLTLDKTYYLVETKAPKGGYVVHAPIKVVFDHDPTWVQVPNYIPEIKTYARDSETGTHTANADDSVTIIDKVHYKHLTPGKNFQMRGRLMNRLVYYDDIENNPSQGEADVTAVEDNGKAVTATESFVASETGEGDVELKFTFNASDFAGKSVVVYEKCYQVNDEGMIKPVAEHQDQANEDQVVNFPEIKTSAKDPDSKTGLGVLKKEETIIDTVEYKKLDPGVTYKMKGTLYDKTTGELIKDENGEPYTVEKEFTPEESSGTIELKFIIDSSALIHHTVVAYEECYLTGEPDVIVAFHKDKEDKEQTIPYPSPKYDMYKVRITDASKKHKTEKYGFKTGDKVFYEVHVVNKGNCPITMDVRDAFEDKAVNYFTLPVVEKVEGAKQNSISENKNVVNITIEKGGTAVITYSSEVLPAAVEYLANAAKDSDSKNKDGKDDNKAYEANKPDNNDGWVNTAYTENPTYPNPEKPEEPVPVPEGPKFDPAQTPIRTPEIGTYLSGKAGKKEVNPSGKTKLVDTIAYSGLTPGRKYEVIGELIVKSTKDPLVENGEKVVATGTFVPRSERGSTKVTFTVNTKGLKGKELVAFETCYDITGLSSDQVAEPEDVEKNGTKVAEHKNLKDKDQTIKIKKASGKPKTGDNNSIIFLSIIFIALAGALAALCAKKKIIKIRR